MRWFDISLKKLKEMVMHPKLRGADINLVFTDVLIEPLIFAYKVFKAYRKENVYRLNKGPLMIDIQAVLNDRWDEGLRRIVVENYVGLSSPYLFIEAEQKEEPYIYTEAEGKPAPILYTQADLNAVTADFVIKVPSFIVFDMDEMIALVYKYCLPDKHFIIQTF